MIEKYIYENPKYQIEVGYNCKLEKAKEMATFTAKNYKGILYSEDQLGIRVQIGNFVNEKKKHKR